MKNLMKMAALAVVLSTGFASCSSDDDANNTVVNGMSILSILTPTHGL